MAKPYTPVSIIRTWWLRSNSFVLLLGLFGVGNLIAQNYSKSCKVADTLFPDADKVLLYKNYHLEVIPDGDTIQFISTNKEVNYIRKNSRMHGAESIYHSEEFADVRDLEAYTINLNTSKKTKFAGYAEGMYFSSNIFYDDNRETYFMYPDVDDQVVTEMEYKMHYYEPHLIPPFYFSMTEPVIYSSLTVTVPKDCEIGWLVKDQGQYKIGFEEKVVKGKNQYTWKLENSTILGSFSGGISASKFLPHVIIWIKKYTTKKGETKVLGGIEDLYGWYSDFVKKAKTRNESIVKNVSDSITRNFTTDQQKANAIFEWVQSNISYVAIEDGYSGFIPRKADDVIQKKYGDCKDMANLLVELMKNCGLDARHVWIGTRDIPYTYYDVFTPIVDNHMIAAVKMDDKFYFLDATGKYMPFGFPTSMIQGKTALVEEGTGHFELVNIDIISSDKNVIRDSVQLEINGTLVSGNGTYTMCGYPMIDSKYELSYAENNSEKSFYKDLLLKGNNKFKLSDYQLDPAPKDKNSMNISYSFEMNDYISTNKDEIFVNMHIGKTDISTLKKQEINGEAYSSNDYRYIKEDVVTLVLPGGYSVGFKPTDYLVEKEFLTYQCIYSLDGNKLTMRRKLTINYLELHKDQINDFNSVVTDVQKFERTNVLLTNKK